VNVEGSGLRVRARLEDDVVIVVRDVAIPRSCARRGSAGWLEPRPISVPPVAPALELVFRIQVRLGPAPFGVVAGAAVADDWPRSPGRCWSTSGGGCRWAA